MDFVLSGVSDDIVEENLTDSGFQQDVVKEAISRLHLVRVEVAKKAGARTASYGMLWLFCGVLLTILSYSAVAESGGHYFIMTGLIAIGALQTLMGLAQMTRGR